MVNPNGLNGITLAYIGDSVYEVYVREYLLEKGLSKVNHLHKEATKYVSAIAQSELVSALLKNNVLREEEKSVFKRGRNAKSHTTAKNADVLAYRASTGFEAVVGYLYLTRQQDRLQFILKWCVDYIGEKNV